MLRAVSQKSRPACVGHRIPSGKLGQSQIQIRTKGFGIAASLSKMCPWPRPGAIPPPPTGGAIAQARARFERFQHARTRHSRRVHNRCRSHVHARTLALRQECPLDAAKRLAAACSAVADGNDRENIRARKPGQKFRNPQVMARGHKCAALRGYVYPRQREQSQHE
jgi:hypothetical protein